MFKLTINFKHEMIGIWQRFQRDFELTVFELTVPDLYTFLLEQSVCQSPILLVTVYLHKPFTYICIA